MPAPVSQNRPFNAQLAVLPIMHALFFVFGAVFDRWSPYGLSPVFCADLPISLPLVGRDDRATVLIVGLLSTAWWYFIGRIGWMSRKGMISRRASIGGAALIFFTCGIASYALASQMAGWTHDARFTMLVIADYVLAWSLLLGGWISGITAAISVLNSSQ